MSALQDTFTAYGPDEAGAALAALANVDPATWDLYVDRAAERQWRADRARWVRSQLRTVERDLVAVDSGQVRLFDVPVGDKIDVRVRVVLDGTEHVLGDLEGAGGAALVRKIAERDEAPASTTLTRCRHLRALADHVEAESDRLGRSVRFAEVLRAAS